MRPERDIEIVWGREAGWQQAEARPQPVRTPAEAVRAVRGRRDHLHQHRECPLRRAIAPELWVDIDRVIAALDRLLARLDAAEEQVPADLRDAGQIAAWAERQARAEAQDAKTS